MGFVEGARMLLRHRAYRVLCGFYILARIAVDLIGAMFLLYFTHWLGREQDFAPTLFAFLVVVVLSLPVWLHFARGVDKRSVFIAGCAGWAAIQLPIWMAQPDWPRWLMFALPCAAAIGYAVADLMPWAMLGEVVDEDELATGERREGMYVGFFMFLRKVGGASAVLAVGLGLDAAGFDGDLARSEQPAAALTAIRVFTSLAPLLLLLLAIGVATRYSLTRRRHGEILEALRLRGAGTGLGARSS
jgi:GPH family glycoside/pentoside/hexuronide:cation symporter